jgi:hypothetical protein
MSTQPDLDRRPPIDDFADEERSDVEQEIAQLQDARLHEYQKQVLAKEYPLQAILGSQAASMWGMAQRLRRELLEEAQLEGDLMGVLKSEPRGMATLFQVERQAERYAQLFLRLNELEAKQRGGGGDMLKRDPPKFAR